MRLLPLIIFSLFIAITGRAEERDKKLHMGYSFLISTSAYAGLRQHKVSKVKASLSAIAITLTVGALKELSDEDFDSEDMDANAIGAVSAPILLWSF